MSKYRVHFSARAYCVKEVEIKDGSNPYKELDELPLKQDDFSIDISSSQVDKLKPLDWKQG